MGVMLFQMLYGRRPFGEGCSQEEILREGVMLRAKAVAFPPKPPVSAEAKEFIGRCVVACMHAVQQHPWLLHLWRPCTAAEGRDRQQAAQHTRPTAARVPMVHERADGACVHSIAWLA